MRGRSSARRPACTRRAKRRSSRSADNSRRRAHISRVLGDTSACPRAFFVISPDAHTLPLRSRAVARNYFGTDGVRGIVGEFVTADLVERLGKASASWSGRGRVFVGRDTRASGVELEEAFARGVASAGGSAVL